MSDYYEMKIADLEDLLTSYESAFKVLKGESAFEVMMQCHSTALADVQDLHKQIQQTEKLLETLKFTRQEKINLADALETLIAEIDKGRDE